MWGCETIANDVIFQPCLFEIHQLVRNDTFAFLGLSPSGSEDIYKKQKTLEEERGRLEGEEDGGGRRKAGRRANNYK
jgi:hypothetical protein